MNGSDAVTRRLAAVPRPVAIVFGLVCLALLAYAAYTSRQPFRFVDERQYSEIARAVAEGRGFVIYDRPSAYRPPVWPLILSVFALAGIQGTSFVVVSAILMIVGAVLLGVVCSRVLRTGHGYWASVAVLLYPVNFYTAATVYPQALAVLLVAALWLIASYAGDHGRRLLSWRIAAACGLVMAALALSVPTMVFTAGLVGMWLVWQQRGNRIKFTAVTLLFFAVPVALWAARNAQELGSPVLFSTTSGENLVIGNNPSATGSSGVDITYPPESIPPEELNEVQRDAFFRDAAVEWITDNPAEAARLYSAKVVNYFSPYNEPATDSRGSDAQKWIATVAFVAVVAGTIVRLLLHRRQKVMPSEWLFLSIFLANAFFMAIFFTRTRFRQPLDTVLIVEAVIALILVTAIVRGRRPEVSETEEKGVNL